MVSVVNITYLSLLVTFNNRCSIHFYIYYIIMNYYLLLDIQSLYALNRTLGVKTN